MPEIEKVQLVDLVHSQKLNEKEIEAIKWSIMGLSAEEAAKRIVNFFNDRIDNIARLIELVNA